MSTPSQAAQQYGLAVGGLLPQAEGPASLKEALAGIEGNMWVAAATEEYESSLQRKAFMLEQTPTDRIVIGSRWIFKTESNRNI